MKLELAFINRESETSIKKIRNLLSNKIKMLSNNKFLIRMNRIDIA